MNGIIEGTISGLIVLAVGGVASCLAKQRIRINLPTKRTKEPTPTEKEAIRIAIAFLQKDQDTTKFFFGQFGRCASKAEEKKYQTGSERLDTKPRLYLTGWPVFVLVKHKGYKPHFSRMLEDVKRGILSLADDSWIRVGMGATDFTHPLRPSSEISYRHTIRAAQILLAINPNSRLPKTVLGRMLDHTRDIQTEQGGWRQCNIEHKSEDLWASAYAVGFLWSCLKHSEALKITQDVAEEIRGSLNSTLTWLQNRWNEDQWKYGGASSEENAPILFHEVAAAATEYRPDIVRAVLSHFESYLDSLSHPNSMYISKTEGVTPFVLSVRLAYAFFITDGYYENQAKCESLKEYAITQLKEPYNSADAAMLLDMLLSKKPVNQAKIVESETKSPLVHIPAVQQDAAPDAKAAAPLLRTGSASPHQKY